MGTTQSKSHANQEWKGPFSDEEYNCLVSKYNELSATTDSIKTIQGKIQVWLSFPLNDDIPQEWRNGLSRIGTSFYDLCIHTRGDNSIINDHTIWTLSDFVHGVAQCVRSSSPSISRAMFYLFASSTPHALYIQEVEVCQLVFACFMMAHEHIAMEEPHHVIKMTKQIVHAMFSTCHSITVNNIVDGIGSLSCVNTSNPPIATNAMNQLSLDDFTQWMGTQAPLLYSVFTTWLSKKCFNKLARPSYYPPRLSIKSDIISKSHFIALSFTCTPLQKQIERIYTSAQDGLSFNRLHYHILGYGGPTLCIIRTTDGDVFGMYCDTEWIETNQFYGNHGCFLFTLEPKLQMYHCISSNQTTNKGQYMYLNTKGYTLPKGLGIGGSIHNFRIFLNEDFDENCYTTNKDCSFESGSITKHHDFIPEAIEVWGCGDETSKLRQEEIRQETSDLINKIRKVDKNAFLNNEFDREMFLGKTFGHGTDQARVVEDEQ